MNKVLFVILIIALLLIPLTVSADTGIRVVSRSGEGIWVGDIWQVSMFPGEVKSTAITFYNPSCSSFTIKLSIIPISRDKGNLAFQLDKSAFVIKGKSYCVVVLIVRASSSVTPGYYTAQLSETYQCTGDKGNSGCNKKIAPWWFFWSHYYRYWH